MNFILLFLFLSEKNIFSFEIMVKFIYNKLFEKTIKAFAEAIKERRKK